MKKIVSVILAIMLVLSGFGVVGVSAASVETEHGVQVEIAPFLYKSTLYPMEFPSKESYAVKEQSLAGDYAISRELNDLSYTFVFPAGTTEIECNVSLNGETDWRGFAVNSTDNANYWEKDASGAVDYSKSLTFRRIEEVAEQDEYGLLYREYLKDANVGGYRDIDKVCWRLTFVCNGETYVDYFDVKLYDYDALEKVPVRAVNFNVAGLPWGNTASNQKVLGEYLSNNNFDIVALQEDFAFHNQLVNNMDGFAYETLHTGSIPGGDGLNVFTKNNPIYNETRVQWNDAYGILSDGSDELTPKGFVYSVIDVGNGIYVDFYNLHADAYGGEGSIAARTSQYKQLADFIEARSAEHDRPVIVTGDFNVYIHSHEDDDALYKTFCQQAGMKDAWIEYHNEGNYFSFSEWYALNIESWGNWDSVERFLYRPGGGVDVVVNDFRYTQVVNENGEKASDHAAAECDFLFLKTDDFVGNTQELAKVEKLDRDIFYVLKWCFKAFVLIMSDIKNLPSIIEELTAA